jgi:hypothetical protein
MGRDIEIGEVEAVKTEKRETNRKLARAAETGSGTGLKKDFKNGTDANNLLPIR